MVSVARALSVSVLAGGRMGDGVVCCRAWVRSLAAATMRSVADEVGILMPWGTQLTVSDMRIALVAGMYVRWQR